MIVDIALVPDALTDVAASRLSRASWVAQRQLFDTLRAHGALILTSEEITDLVSFIRDSPSFTDNERARWRELLLFLRQRERLVVVSARPGMKLSEVTGMEDLARFGTPEAGTVLVLDSDHFDRLFPANSAGVARPSPQISVATPVTLGEVESIDQSRSLAVRGSHPHGHERELVWGDLFAPIVRRSSHLTVVDGYLFAQIARRDDGYLSRDTAEHVGWLLNHVATTAPLGTRVRLMSAFDEDRTLVPRQAAQVLEMVLRHWVGEPGSIVELEVVMASRRDFPHNRHIRLGGLGFVLHEGLDRLRSPHLWDTDGFNWEYKWTESGLEELRARELRVETASSVSRAVRTLP